MRAATVKLDGIEFANPSWAREPYLVRAERATFDIRLWPLLAKRVVIPHIFLASPALGLQMEEDGRRTWALGKNTADEGTVPVIGLLEVDQARSTSWRHTSASICAPTSATTAVAGSCRSTFASRGATRDSR